MLAKLPMGGFDVEAWMETHPSALQWVTPTASTETTAAQRAMMAVENFILIVAKSRRGKYVTVKLVSESWKRVLDVFFPEINVQ